MRKQPVVLALIAVTVGVSILGQLSFPVAHALALVPAEVFRGQVWRLVTWAFLEYGAVGLLVTTISLYKFGGDLLQVWGRRRFTRFVAGIIVGAGAGACLLAIPIPNAVWFPRFGGLALADALTIAWALQFPDRQLLIYHILPLGGDRLAYAILAVTVTFISFYGLTPFAPDLVAALAALAYMKRWWDRLTPAPVTPSNPWAN